MNRVLCHHGIHGQRWGVRRFQNEDGSLTAAGRKRYNVNIGEAEKNLASYKQAYNKAKQAYNTKKTRNAATQLNKAKAKLDIGKKALKDEKIKERLNNEKKKSKHRLKLEEHYRQQGMTEEEAAIAAYKRTKTEKIIAVTAGLTIAAAATYIARKQYKKNVDGFIQEGTVLSRIESDNNASVHDAFYASMKRSDNSAYAGYYGKALQQNGAKSVYQKKINVNKGIKVASEKSAIQALQQLSSSDPNFTAGMKKELQDSYNAYKLGQGTEKQRKVFKKALDSLNQGKVDKNVMNAVNVNLVERGETTKKFYQQLAKNGYGAIVDKNDKYYSGYNTKMPLVVFNSDVSVSSVKKLGSEEINKKFNQKLSKETLKSVAPMAAVGAAALAAVKGLGAKANSNRQRTIVSEYRKEHPNSTLSDNEILLNYYQ